MHCRHNFSEQGLVQFVRKYDCTFVTGIVRIALQVQIDII